MTVQRRAHNLNEIGADILERLEFCAGFVLRVVLCSVTNCGGCLADRSNGAAPRSCWWFCGRFGPHLCRIRNPTPGGCRPGEQRSPVVLGEVCEQCAECPRKQAKRGEETLLCVAASLGSHALSSLSMLLEKDACASVAHPFSAKGQTVLFLLLRTVLSGCQNKSSCVSQKAAT